MWELIAEREETDSAMLKHAIQNGIKKIMNINCFMILITTAQNAHTSQAFSAKSKGVD